MIAAKIAQECEDNAALAGEVTRGILGKLAKDYDKLEPRDLTNAAATSIGGKRREARRAGSSGGGAGRQSFEPLSAGDPVADEIVNPALSDRPLPRSAPAQPPPSGSPAAVPSGLSAPLHRMNIVWSERGRVAPARLA
jgi:hypothetical protein